MADFDNNGLPDLFMVAGHTFPEVEKKHPEFPAKDPRMLFRNLGKGNSRNSRTKPELPFWNHTTAAVVLSAISITMATSTSWSSI